MNMLIRKKKNIIIAGIVLILTIIILIFGNPLKVNAVGEKNIRKTAACVMIENGDTLWGLACEYYTPECGSIEAYIKEIKKTNNMKTDAIFEGCYIIIPHYTDSSL